MNWRKTIHAIYIFCCMCALGFLIGHEYQVLIIKGEAGFLRWTFGLLAIIGWTDILWKAAFRLFRSPKKRRNYAGR